MAVAVSIEAEKESKVKMTEAEFYAKLDRSMESAKNGNTIAMEEGETTDQFIDRLLCVSMMTSSMFLLFLHLDIIEIIELIRN